MASRISPLYLTATIIAVSDLSSNAHEGFLPLHEHSAHRHAHHDHSAEEHAAHDGKGHKHVHTPHQESRWAVATGVRYTKYAAPGIRGSLWETGLGLDYTVLPWLHIGGDVSYGWFSSPEGDADGWLIPHFHADVHLPLGGKWEVVTGLEIGFPAGEENLTGDHWEWAPHVELRRDAGPWYVAAGASFAISSGDSHDHDDHAQEGHEEHEHDHEDEAHDHAAHQGHTGDFHEIVDPHGERELRYYAAFGVRVFDEKVTLESRLSGVHVTSDDTEFRNYLRGGLRVNWQIRENLTFSTEGSVPLTNAERNDWQASAALRVAF